MISVPGRQVTVTCSGLDAKPDLVYVLQLYKQRPYGTAQVKVQNSAGKEVTVQAIRSVEARGEPILNLGGGQSADRVLSDSFSEDWNCDSNSQRYNRKLLQEVIDAASDSPAKDL